MRKEESGKRTEEAEDGYDSVHLPTSFSKTLPLSVRT